MTPSYIHELPPRTESVIAAARHAIEIDDPIAHSAVSSIDAPSAVAAVQENCPDWRPTFGEIPEPDPREPFDDTGIALWSYDYDTNLATPILGEPDARVFELVNGIAQTPYNLDQWADLSKDAYREFPSVHSSKVLSAMVQPCPCPDDYWPWDWRFRIQVACALMLGQIDAAADPSEGGNLQRLLNGQVDWTSTAAAFRLIARARADADALPLCLSALIALLQQPMSPIWYMCAYEPVFRLLRDFPQLPDSLSESVQRANDQFDSETE